MKLCLFAMTALVFAAASARAQVPNPPAEWADFLRLERGYNIYDRLHPDRKNPEVLFADEPPIRVLSWEVPQAEVRTYSSSFAPEATKNWVEVTHGDKHFIRVFIPETDEKTVAAFRKQYGKPNSEHWGIHVLGHNGFWVWNPSEPNAPRYWVKRMEPGQVELSVSANNLVEQQFRGNPSDLVAYMPERIGAEVQLKDGTQYGQVIREIGIIEDATPETRVVPLHGFLGAPDLAETAKQAGLSRDAWIEEEYIPKLAKAFAELQYRYGIHIEGHTQNLLLVLNRQTGRIEKIVFKDMHDLELDAYSVLAKGSPIELPASQPLFLNISGYLLADQDTQAGNLFALSSQQSILAFEPDQAKRFRFAARFLREFVPAAEKWVEHPIQLSESAKTILAALEEQVLKKLRRGIGPDRISWEQRNNLIATGLGRVVQEINDQVAQQRGQAYLNHPSIPGYSQRALARAFQERLRSDGVLPLSSSYVDYFGPQDRAPRNAANPLAVINQPELRRRVSNADLQYSYDGKDLIAFNRQTKRVIAIVPTLSPDSLRPPSLILRCVSWLKKPK